MMNAFKKITSVILAAAAAAAFVTASPITASAAYRLTADVSKDGKVQLRDATLAQKIALGLLDGDPEQIAVGDLNGTGAVELADAYLIQRYATHDTTVMNGTAEGMSTAVSPCPDRASRISFYTALNEARVAKGLAPIAVNDGMLAAGNEASLQFREEIKAGSGSEYSGSRYYVNEYGDRDSITYAFPEYGLPYYNSSSLEILPYKISTASGSSLFNKIANSTDEAFTRFYSEYLMSPEVTVVCVGSQKTYSGATRAWVLIAY